MPLSPGCERLARRASDAWVGRAASVSRRRRLAPASVAKGQRREADHSRLVRVQAATARPSTRDAPAAVPREGPSAPLARQRGGRPRWRDTPAESGGAAARRRSCGCEGCRRLRTAARRWCPAGQRRCSGGWRRTRPQTELAESEERDPPTGPARHRLRAHGASVRHGVTSGTCGVEPVQVVAPVVVPPPRGSGTGGLTRRSRFKKARCPTGYAAATRRSSSDSSPASPTSRTSSGRPMRSAARRAARSAAGVRRCASHTTRR